MSAKGTAFHVGQPVRVLTLKPTGHFRTPGYVRGRVGVVHELTGEYLNAETLAHGGDGRPPRMMYRVRFTQPTLWPDYTGPATDTVVVDIYEHWLEPAPGAPTEENKR